MRSVQARLLALLLLAPVLAGCLALPQPEAPVLSEPRFPALPGASAWLAASTDDVPLHVRVFLPDAAEDPAWRAPTILVMSPYFGYDAREDAFDAASRPTYFRYQWLIDHFVPRGYAVAFADVRGTGDSGGCLAQTAREQWQDGVDVVEWLAAEPWSNGRVGMFGKSYDAETQQSTAVLAPVALKAIVPVSSVSGQYEYSYYDGVPYTLQTLESNADYMMRDGLKPPTTREGLAAYWQRPGCHPMMLAQGLDSSGDWNDFWEDREFRKHASDVTAAVLYVHGLQDWNVKPVAIRDWLDRLPPATTRAILGQWAHDYPEENRHVAEWSRQDWRETVHLWFDHFLLGLENGVLDRLPPVQVQDTAGEWRREDAWPPRDARPLVFDLAPGALTLGGGREPLHLREDVERWTATTTGVPVPTGGSDPFADRLVLDSEPFAGDVRVAGWPTLSFTATMTDLTASRREADAHLAAILYVVSPDGDARWVDRGYLSMRHREGVERPQPVPTGVPLEATLRFFPADVLVPAGHHLRLVLQGSDDWTQPEGSLWGAVLEDAALTLPVVERDLRAVGLDVPMGEPVRS